jgi:hypothetical protein
MHLRYSIFEYALHKYIDSRLEEEPHLWCNIMGSSFTSNAVDRGFESRGVTVSQLAASTVNSISLKLTFSACLLNT